MKGIMRGMQLFAILVGVGLLVVAPAAWGQGVGSGTLTVTNDGLCSGSGFVDFDSPNHWDMTDGNTIHINIAPGFSICTAGVHLDTRCSSNADCSASGTCNSTIPGCTGAPGLKTCNSNSANIGSNCTYTSQCVPIQTCSPNSPINAGGSCTTNSDCSVSGTCASALECSGDTTVFVKGKTDNPCTQDSDCTGSGETGCDTGDGLCKFVDTISTSGRTGNGALDVCYTTRANACSTATVAYCDRRWRAS